MPDVIRIEFLDGLFKLRQIILLPREIVTHPHTLTHI